MKQLLFVLLFLVRFWGQAAAQLPAWCTLFPSLPRIRRPVRWVWRGSRMVQRGLNRLVGGAGVGAIATQSFAEASYGPLGLALMRAGKTRGCAPGDFCVPMVPEMSGKWPWLMPKETSPRGPAPPTSKPPAT